ARPAFGDAARNIGVGAEALLAAVEPVARAAFLFGEGALIGIGIIARNRPAPVAEHAVDARRTGPVLRAAVAAARIVRVAAARAEQRQAVGLVETQADRRLGHLVDIAHQRAVDHIFVARGGEATRGRTGREDGVVVNEI